LEVVVARVPTDTGSFTYGTALDSGTISGLVQTFDLGDVTLAGDTANNSGTITMEVDVRITDATTDAVGTNYTIGMAFDHVGESQQTA
jgi:hypothetical protein